MPLQVFQRINWNHFVFAGALGWSSEPARRRPPEENCTSNDQKSAVGCRMIGNRERKWKLRTKVAPQPKRMGPVSQPSRSPRCWLRWSTKSHYQRDHAQ